MYCTVCTSCPLRVMRRYHLGPGRMAGTGVKHRSIFTYSRLQDLPYSSSEPGRTQHHMYLLYYCTYIYRNIWLLIFHRPIPIFLSPLQISPLNPLCGWCFETIIAGTIFPCSKPFLLSPSWSLNPPTHLSFSPVAARDPLLPFPSLIPARKATVLYFFFESQTRSSSKAFRN